MSTLSISTIQSDIIWEEKSSNLLQFEEKIKSLAGKTNVVILPEMFNTGFSMRATELAEAMNGPCMNWLKRVSAENRVVLTGSFMAIDNNQYFNRLIWMLPNGTFAYYDKKHLFAYSGEDQHFSAGNKRLICSVNGWRWNTQICYDLRFPVWARQNPKSSDDFEYDILLYVASWPERRNHAWKSLLIARAIENQCYVIAVNRVGIDGNNIAYSGDSMIIDPLGEILYHHITTEAIFTIELTKEKLEELRNKFPFYKDADSFRLEP